MTSERDEFFYHENLIHPASISHPQPRTALIIGGGDGGAAEELLKHPSIEKVVLVELDGKVIEIARAHFASVHRGAFDDPASNCASKTVSPTCAAMPPRQAFASTSSFST